MRRLSIEGPPWTPAVIALSPANGGGVTTTGGGLTGGRVGGVGPVDGGIMRPQAARKSSSASAAHLRPPATATEGQPSSVSSSSQSGSAEATLRLKLHRSTASTASLSEP